MTCPARLFADTEYTKYTKYTEYTEYGEYTEYIRMYAQQREMHPLQTNSYADIIIINYSTHSVPNTQHFCKSGVGRAPHRY